MADAEPLPMQALLDVHILDPHQLDLVDATIEQSRL